MLLVVVGPCVDGAVAVVDPRVTTGTLTTDRVRDLLLGRISIWPSGEAVVIVLCTDVVGEQAVQQICSRSVGLLRRGWKRLVFAGTGAMPLVTDTWQGAVALVERTPGAIVVLAEPPPANTALVVPLQWTVAIPAP